MSPAERRAGSPEGADVAQRPAAGTPHGESDPAPAADDAPQTLLPGGVRTRSAWLVAIPFFLLASPTPWRLAMGAGVSVAGLALRGWSAGTIHKGEVLTTWGPYAFLRHPLYAGSFLIGGGLAIAGGSWLWLLLFLGFFAGVYGPTISAEVARLTERFGHRYVEYAARVPAFVPRLSPFRGERGLAGGFRWTQYGRNREWEALAGAAAAFGALWLKMGWFS